MYDMYLSLDLEVQVRGQALRVKSLALVSDYVSLTPTLFNRTISKRFSFIVSRTFRDFVGIVTYDTDHL